MTRAIEIDKDAIRDRVARINALSESNLTGMALTTAAGLLGAHLSCDVEDLLARVEELEEALTRAEKAPGANGVRRAVRVGGAAPQPASS